MDFVGSDPRSVSNVVVFFNALEISRKLYKLIYTHHYYSGALVRQRTIPTERPPLVGEVSAYFSG
jgi:hypothetical protein